MKLFLCLMITTALTALTQISFANNIQNETTITCPPEIICTADRSISSCKPVGDNLQYWDKIQDEGPVTKGTHAFNYALTSYQSPNYDNTVCYYQGMHIYAKGFDSADSALEALPNNTTNWIISGYRADCRSNNPQMCPFNKLPALLLKADFNNNAFVIAYANSIQIIERPLYSQQQEKITLYQAWNGCGNGKVCTINFTANENGVMVDIGNISVDLANQMQILQINSKPTSGYKISHSSDLNSLIITRQ